MTLDETKAQKASLSTIKSLFQGGGSYGDTIGDKATATYRLANSASYKTSEEPDIAARERILLLATPVIYWINCYK